MILRKVFSLYNDSRQKASPSVTPPYRAGTPLVWHPRPSLPPDGILFSRWEIHHSLNSSPLMYMMDAISFDSLPVRSMCIHIRLMKAFGCSKIGVRPSSVMPAFRVRRRSYFIHEPAGGIDSAGPCAQSVAVFSVFFLHMACPYM